MVNVREEKLTDVAHARLISQDSNVQKNVVSTVQFDTIYVWIVMFCLMLRIYFIDFIFPVNERISETYTPDTGQHRGHRD